MERKKAMGIERFLKNKFREGFNTLKQQFEDLDPELSGIVSSSCGDLWDNVFLREIKRENSILFLYFSGVARWFYFCAGEIRRASREETSG